MTLRINEKPDWKSIPHQSQPDSSNGWAAILGNRQNHRATFLQSNQNVERIVTVDGGNENQSLPLWAIALGKALTARDEVNNHPEQYGINPEEPVHYIIAQDAKNENKPKPENSETIAQNLRDILIRYHREGRCYYTNRSATAIVNGHTEIHQSSMTVFLNPQRLKQIYEDPLLFETYADACQYYAGISPLKAAGGICLEALIALGAVTDIAGHPLPDTTQRELLQTIKLGLHQVLAPIPTHIFGDASSVLEQRGTPYSENLHRDATLLQKEVNSSGTIR